MTRYVTLRTPPKSYDVEWHNMPAIVKADTVYEADDAPQDTGLLNADGTKLYRVPDPKKIGFL